MNQAASDTPLLDRNRTGNEHDLKYKLAFLNGIFLAAALISLGLGAFRWQFSPVLAAFDFGFSLAAFALLLYLRRHPGKIEAVGSVALVLGFVLFFAIYLLAPYQTNRLSLFSLLSASAFFLKGIRIGLVWLAIIIFAIVATHFVPGAGTGFSDLDIATTCLYLGALFFIFWHYETLKQDQYRREREQGLQRLIDERWRLALEGAGDALWDWDIAGNVFLHSKSYGAMLGYDESFVVRDPEQLKTFLHPEDEAPATARLAAYLEGRAGALYVSEQRMRCADGSYKWILCRGSVTRRDAAGRPQRMVGTHVDVTERKRASEEILQSRQALAEERGLFQAILDNAPLGIWMIDARGKARFVNREFCDATGIAEERFLAAASYTGPLPENFAAGCIRSDKDCCEQEAPHVSLEGLRFVDGRQHLLEITRVRLLDHDGSIRGIVALAVDATERVEHQRQLEHIAHYDTLTGVPNRVLLVDRLAQALARAKRDRRLMAVCYVDLDGFKQINDSFGHDAGDRVLVEVTRRIKEAVREDDTVARLGGDEFVVLLVGLEQAEECAGTLHRLLERISQPIPVHGEVLSVSASIGVALYPEDEEDADTLLRHADQAMYVAKQAGKNRYHLFDADSDQRARSHHEFLQQFRHGLADGEFELYYQPKVAMDTRRLVGAEALIRWKHPRRGHLLPEEFLRMVEDTELEIELGDWVVATALGQLRQWRLEGFEIDLSINISAYHLQSKGFVQKLKDSAIRHDATDCLRRLQIEVLETAALEDISRIGALIEACRELGVGFALDDFGTGYSSLTYLSKLDVDTLKIDQSFVRDMLVDKGDHAVVHGIIALARAFDMSIVAEGVETEAHFQALFQIGCEVGQGFGIAYPMPAHELVRWRGVQESADLF
jgi:diguanylate cyclase (GGDEF)-like protein/PAS domain S-box-containing protein